ncbi:MAG: response regulator [Kiritimatiellales bacterium]
MPRILIVDDAPPILIMLSKLLTEEGYEVATAKHGEEAVQLLKTERFDLMISDLNMRPVNGAELLRKTRKAYPEMGVILLTAYETMFTAEQAAENGAFAYIVKPFKNAKLLETVHRGLAYYM